MKVTVDQAFWDLFPQAQVVVMTVEDIDNHVDESKDPYFKDLLDKGIVRSKEYIDEDQFTASPVVQEWRQAFTKFKTKKGARSSIEALLKRVSQGREFYPINPLVDLYNSVSLAYAIPCGGEDMEKIAGGLSLGKAKGGEPFFPLGAEEDAPALREERAVCRCLNWREAQRTMLTEETRQAILVMEAVTEEQAGRAKEAMDELKGLVKDYFGVEGKISYLSAQEASLEV